MLEVVVIEVPVGGVVAVVGDTGPGAVLVAALVGPPPGEGCAQVLRHAKGHVQLLGGSLPHPADVLVRADLHGVEAVQVGIEVEEMVVMHSLRHKVARAGLVVALHQRVGVKVFGLPQGAYVLPAELGGVSVGAQVMLVLGRVLQVHIPGVPVAAHGHGLRTPVAPDAELRIPEPFGAFKGAERFKGCLKHGGNHLIIGYWL